MGVRIRRDKLEASGALEVAREQISKAIRLAGGDSPGDRDAVVHEVRKRIKKARALVQLSRSAAGRKAIERADRRLREASRPLSTVRDASALIATLDALADRSLGLVPVAAFDAARSGLLGHRDRVIRDELDRGDALRKAAKSLRSARRRLAGWDPGDERADPIEDYRHAYRRAREAYKLASSGPSVESLHELRKRSKAFAYQLRVLGSDPAGPVARLSRLAALLSDELGELHDLDVLRSFVSDRAGAAPVLATLDRRRLDLRRLALQRAGVVFFDKPGAFSGTLAASWDRLERVRDDG